jgi:hypothetical protein
MFIKVDYTSIKDSQIAMDYICHNPSFHSRARYDCALFNAGGGQYTIGHIVSILGVLDNKGKERKYAMVIPFDWPVFCTVDKQANLDCSTHLRFTHL